MAAARKITLKLLIDKEKKRVVFAESDNDFVDILFSFLTLPMGTIIRLLGKQSNLGCFDNLYESVENLDTKYLQTEACKAMLLRPLSAAEYQCENLAIQVDDTQPMRAFMCMNEKCRSNNFLRAFNGSTVQNTRCLCGGMMKKGVTVVENPVVENPLWKGNCVELDSKRVFVKGNVKFIISDHLEVMPASTESINILLNKFSGDSGIDFEEQIVEFGRFEVMNLLKCSLHSTAPLTDVFMPNSKRSHDVKFEVKDEIEAHNEKEVKMEASKIKVKMFLSKSDSKVLYVEAEEELVDLLFSLLVLPLGSIVEYFAGNSFMGSIDNLYRSVEDMNLSGCVIYEDRKSLLLSPKLASYFDCENQLIQTPAMLPCTPVVSSCIICDSFHGDADTSTWCFHKKEPVKLKCFNPKNLNPRSKSKGRYAKGPTKFIVTDEMVVRPLSLMTIMSASHQMKKPDFVVEEKEFSFGRAEVMALLRGTLFTRSALSSAFSQKWKERM